MFLVLLTSFFLNRFFYSRNSLYANIYNHDSYRDPNKLFVFDANSFLNETEYQDLLDTIIRSPKTEADIRDDSFQGFLKNEFYSISHKNDNNIHVIDFDTFLIWRKKVGTLFYDYEIKDFYYSITDDYLDLMQFIHLNNIIDENDTPLF